jgi:hypothetical protein
MCAKYYPDRYSKFRTPRQKQIMELFKQGYSVDAIACKLGIKFNTVGWYLRKIHVPACTTPPGYITIEEAARKVGMGIPELRKGIKLGDLRFVMHNRRIFTTHTWVRNFINNLPYRLQAKKMQEKLFQAHPKLAE